MDERLKLGKRLADYVRMTIEIGEIKADSPVGIAYRDFIEEWNKTKKCSSEIHGIKKLGGYNTCPDCGLVFETLTANKG